MARILLADDDAALREFASRALAIDGHEVTLASGGVEALAWLTAGDARFDLLVTDIHMPAMDGLSLAEEAGKACAGMPVLLMSGFAVEAARIAATGANVAGLLHKPFTLAEVRARARAALLTRP